MLTVVFSFISYLGLTDVRGILLYHIGCVMGMQQRSKCGSYGEIPTSELHSYIKVINHWYSIKTNIELEFDDITRMFKLC